MWTQSGTTNIATFHPADAYANAVLEFTVRNDADYASVNDMTRMSLQTFMLNQFQLTGNFNGAASHTGTVSGKPVLMVKDLSGNLPQIRLDATSSGTGAGFTFAINNEIQLLDDLQITGNGTQQFVLGGSLRDYYQTLAPTNPNYTKPHNVTKTGTSQLILRGNDSFGGQLTVNGGSVVVDGASAAISGASGVVIGGGANLTLSNGGRISSHANVSVSGTLAGSGSITGSVNVLSGGHVAPGLGAGAGVLSTGAVAFNSGAGLDIGIGGLGYGTQYDSLMVNGAALLDGVLNVSLLNGFTPKIGDDFLILSTSQGVFGHFSSLNAPALQGAAWQISYTNPSFIDLTLVAGESTGPTLTGMLGDYNNDGRVDAADYVIYRKAAGSNVALPNGNGVGGLVGAAQYDLWRNSFGNPIAGNLLTGDYNNDGTVDGADYVIYRKVAGLNVDLPNDNVAGGPVGAAQYDLWRNGFGNTVAGTLSSGDFNNDGTVDGADYVIYRKYVGTNGVLPNDLTQYDLWRSQFGASLAGGSDVNIQSIPEPTEFALLLIGLSSCIPLRANSTENKMRFGKANSKSRALFSYEKPVRRRVRLRATTDVDSAATKIEMDQLPAQQDSRIAARAAKPPGSCSTMSS